MVTTQLFIDMLAARGVTSVTSAHGRLADLGAAARLRRAPAALCGVRLPAHHLPHFHHGRSDGAAAAAGGGGAAVRVSRRRPCAAAAFVRYGFSAGLPANVRE